MQAQIDTVRYNVLRMQIVEGDTFYVVNLREVEKKGKKKKRSVDDEKRFAKLVHDVKRALPYAKLAAFRMQLIEQNLAQITDEETKKAYLKKADAGLKKQFENQLKNLTIDQGKILVKLIYRETGKTTYTIIKEYQGGFKAFTWNNFGKIYGHNLKDEYDPSEEYEIEFIIKKLGFN
ncbi:MAG: DUF4294 domain-containing protein [Bacteroidetes bacterium]|nr:DUF4294 domain-containing protein [Bacteroidota bacterium]